MFLFFFLISLILIIKNINYKDKNEKKIEKTNSKTKINYICLE